MLRALKPALEDNEVVASAIACAVPFKPTVGVASVDVVVVALWMTDSDMRQGFKNSRY